MRFLFVIVLFVALPVFAGEKKVTKSIYGEKWPLTVSSGTLTCRPPGAVSFTSEGETYAVNGLATSHGHGVDIRPIWKDAANGYSKISLGPLIQDGLKLCD